MRCASARWRRKEKPRYDGTLAPGPWQGAAAGLRAWHPCSRFREPAAMASVAWDDKVKGRIEIANAELDDLVIARHDGTPTYNFCVVVDDMRHGHHPCDPGRRPCQQHAAPDQHLCAPWAMSRRVYAHLPTVLNEQGEKMSKRNGAKPVTQYRDEGFLPDAMVNYLARLGWSHGDDEIFSARAVPAMVRSWTTSAAALRSSTETKLLLGQCPAPQGHRPMPRWPHWWPRNSTNRGIDRRRTPAAACAPVQGPLRHHGGARRLGPGLLCRRASPSPKILRQHLTDAVRPALAPAPRQIGRLRLGQGLDCRCPRRTRWQRA
jgi:hypothetical protein